MTVYALMVEEQIDSVWIFEMNSLYTTFEKATEVGKSLPNDIPFYVEPVEVS